MDLTTICADALEKISNKAAIEGEEYAKDADAKKGAKEAAAKEAGAEEADAKEAAAKKGDAKEAQGGVMWRNTERCTKGGGV